MFAMHVCSWIVPERMWKSDFDDFEHLGGVLKEELYTVAVCLSLVTVFVLEAGNEYLSTTLAKAVQ